MRRIAIQHMELPNGCWICVSHKPGHNGYPRTRHNGIMTEIHRIVFADRKGMIPKGVVIRHSCDNRMCINPYHLLSGSQKDNVNDMIIRGRINTSRGTKSGRSKLTNDQVIEIANSNESSSILSKRYKVSDSTISSIRCRQTWKHLNIKTNA